VEDEGLAAGRFEAAAGLRVGLQVEPLGPDQGNEHIVHVQTAPAEHAACARRAQRRQQLQAVDGELVHRGPILHNGSVEINPEHRWNQQINVRNCAAN
jgi:hypothetical protein